MTIWFDVEDLIRYYQYASRPTGIQRLSFETYREIWHQAGRSGDVRFCRRNAAQTGFRAIHFPALEAGIRAAAASVSASVSPIRAPATAPRSPSRLRQAARRLPPQYRVPLGRLAQACASGLASIRQLAAAPFVSRGAGPAPGNGVGGHHFDLDGPDVAFAPGDWFVNLGASWDIPYEQDFLGRLRTGGIGFAVLTHDLIPHLFPEWCTGLMVSGFADWLHRVVPQSDVVFAVSRNTAQDLQRCLPNAARPVVVPAGAPVARALTLTPRPRDPPYVLMVGTIEARKNHAAMMRVWRRMLATMPAHEVPDLVFAGKPGWLTSDLMQQLGNANWLDGKIRFIDSPSESELASLYRDCLFTLFPSLYEGWGLPVTESLSFGKTAAASNRAAIPEAGGGFCAYFDPDNLNEAYEVIRGLIENPARVAALEAKIKAEFRPPSWADTAAAVLCALTRHTPIEYPATKKLQAIS